MKSEQTKKYKKEYILFNILSILCSITPIIIYTIIGLVNGSIGQKTTLGICLLVTIIFTIFNILFKHRIKCTIWIMLIGIYLCIDNIMPLLFIMAGTTALDEFVFVPLAKAKKNKYNINKEIDKRLN